MAYNLPPPPGGEPPFPDGGFGLGGIPGFGKSFNLDYSAGLGLPGLWGGGFPGWASPYVPITPLGSLWGFKGDLIVPMVAIGVALFILLLIVLAVKYALAWKLEALDDLAGAKRYRRDAGNAPAPQLEEDNLNRLADVVAAAVYSEGCSKRILCEIGAFAREGKQYTSLLRLIELVVPRDYHDNLVVVRESAEGKFNCADQYPCGNSKHPGNPDAQDPAHNEIDDNPLSAANRTSTASKNTTTSSTTSATTPAPSLLTKFQRSMMK